MIEFRVLGPVELWVSGQRKDLGPARQREILAALLVEPQRPTSLDCLVGRIWDGNPPQHVRNVVYTYIARLRRTLGIATRDSGMPVSLLKDSTGYLLDVSPDQVDLIQFRRRLSRARSAPLGDPDRARLLAEALRLWQGEALGGLGSSWASELRRSLQLAKFDALAEWADTEMHAGRSTMVIDSLRHALLEDPLAEQLHERLMRALHLCGRDTDALQQFGRARVIIADELGTDPGPGLRELHQRLLQGKPPSGIGATARQTMPPDGIAPPPGGSGPCAPDLLPMDLDDFSGRREQLKCLCRALAPGQKRGPRMVAITGAGGVGKTALAVHAAHELKQDFPDGRLYVDLHGKRDLPVDPRAVLGRLLHALGVETSWIPANLDARAELYRNRLSGKRVLVVLDDASGDEQIKALLPGSSSCAVIVTSRCLIGGTTGLPQLPLRELPADDAVDMLSRIAGRTFGPGDLKAARQLARYCSCLPLALRAIGARMAWRSHETPAQLAQYLADEERRLDVLSYAACDTRASLDLSYHRLDAVSARVFRFLGTRCRPDSEFVAEPMPGLSLADAQEACERLAEMHLLQVAGLDEAGRVWYRMLELHRIYARTRAVAGTGNRAVPATVG